MSISDEFFANITMQKLFSSSTLTRSFIVETFCHKLPGTIVLGNQLPRPILAPYPLHQVFGNTACLCLCLWLFLSICSRQNCWSPRVEDGESILWPLRRPGGGLVPGIPGLLPGSPAPWDILGDPIPDQFCEQFSQQFSVKKKQFFEQFSHQIFC